MTREDGVVANVYAGRGDDLDCLFVEVMVRFEDGNCQPFALMPANLQRKRAAILGLCILFRVSDFQQIIGRSCTVLRAWPHEHEPIEGLEVDGRRFTMTSFDHAPSPMDRKRTALTQDIDWTRARLMELEDRLARLPNEYVDWSQL